jgi:MscS family membrane protein
MPASERSPDQAALLAADKTYEQRSNSFNAVIASLQTFLSKAAGGDRLLRGLSVGTAIDAVNELPGITDVNAGLFPSGRLTLGQVVAGVAVFAALIGIGLLLLPLLVRALGWMVSRLHQSMAEEQRFTRMLQKSLDWPLRVLLLLFALNTAGRIVLLRAPDTGLVNVLAILVVLIVVWAVLRLIDNAVATFSEQLRKGHPNLRGELVNFVSNMARIAVVIITALYLLSDLGYDISTLLASLVIGGLAVAFAAKETPTYSAASRSSPTTCSVRVTGS